MKGSQWRAWWLLTLGRLLGPRQNALRHLRWEDVDLDARTVTSRRGFDKLGKERPQPLPRDDVRCFRIARVWARRDGYDGPWVFYGAQERTRSKPYTYQALNAYLRATEERAGIEHIRHRAMHGFRRMSAGNALEAPGGNVRAAGDWIGDSDVRTLTRYLKRREVRQRELAAMMSAPRATPTANVRANRNQNESTARKQAAEGELSASVAP